MSRIARVIPADDYTMTIELKNHNKIVYNMEHRLKSARFCILEDINKFKAFNIEYGSTIVWDGLCQITLDEIINNIER